MTQPEDGLPALSILPTDTTPTRRKRLQDDLGVSWVAGPILGSGIHAENLCLWLKQDHAGKIIDRFVYKDSTIEDIMWPYWERVKGAAKTLPNEILAMRRLKGLQGSECIVRLRNYRLANLLRPNKSLSSEMRMHLYLEYCPFKPVQKLAEAHKQWRLRHDKALDSNSSYIPEPFLWTLFESLAKAGLLMQFGSLDATNPRPGWDLILHRDMHAQNILLGSKSSGTFRNYPVPKLADFGKALILPHSEDHITTIRNPVDAAEFGGCPYEAPEEHRDKLVGQKDPDRFQRYSGQVNVWAVGHLMWLLICGEEAHECEFMLEEVQKPAPFPGNIDEFYSKKLLNLVYECVEYLPEDRPHFSEILERIRSTDGSETARAVHDLRYASEDHGMWKHHQLNIGKEEGYPLRSMLVDEAEKDDKFQGMVPPPPPKPVDKDDYTESEREEKDWELGRRKEVDLESEWEEEDWELERKMESGKRKRVAGDSGDEPPSRGKKRLRSGARNFKKDDRLSPKEEG